MLQRTAPTPRIPASSSKPAAPRHKPSPEATSAHSLPPPFSEFFAHCCRYYDIMQVLCITLVTLNALSTSLSAPLRTPHPPTLTSHHPPPLPPHPPSAPLPWLPFLAISSYRGQSFLLIYLVNTITLVTAIWHPQLYTSRLRTPLLLTFRIGSKLLLCKEVLLTLATGLPSALVAEQCGSVQGVLLMIGSAAMRPLPLKLHLRVVWLECAACYLCNAATICSSTARMPRALWALLLFDIAGAAIATAVTALVHCAVGACYRHMQDTVQAAAGARHCGDAKHASGSLLQPCYSGECSPTCAGGAGPSGGDSGVAQGSVLAAAARRLLGRPVHVQPAEPPPTMEVANSAASAAADPVGAAVAMHGARDVTSSNGAPSCLGVSAAGVGVQAVGAARAPASDTAARAGDGEWRCRVAVPPGAPAAASERCIVITPPQAGARRRRMPYTSSVETTTVSVKIHDHRAYIHRGVIIAPLEAHLTLRSAAPTLLTTMAAPGCLQLVFSTTTFLQGGASRATGSAPPDDLPPPPPPPAPTSALPLLTTDATFSELYAALPQFCRADDVSVHAGDRRALFPALPTPAQVLSTLPSVGAAQPDAAALAGGAAAAAAAAAAGCGALLLEPACVEAGLGCGLEARLVGCEGGAGGQEVQVVACGTRDGKSWVHQEAACLQEGADALRLSLPPGIESGPLFVYVFDKRAGEQGVLLGACTTMVLPTAAATETLRALSDAADDAEERAGILRLLSDYAAAWQLLGENYDGCMGAALLAGLLQYCSNSELHACQSVLADRCTAAGWLVHYSSAAPAPGAAHDASPQVPGAAAAAGRLCGAAAAAVAPPPAFAACEPTTGEESCATTSPSALPAVEAKQPKGGGQRAGSGGGANAVGSYDEWKMQTARNWDKMVLLFNIGIFSALLFFFARNLHRFPVHPGNGLARCFVTIMIHMVSIAGPHALLLLCGPWLQRRRGALMACHAAFRGCVYLLGCNCVLLHMKFITARFAHGFMPIFLSGLMRPLSQRTTWYMQLPSAAFEEVCKAILLFSPTCEADATPSPMREMTSNPLVNIAIVVAATATSYLLELALRSAYHKALLRASYQQSHGPGPLAAAAAARAGAGRAAAGKLHQA